MQDAYIQVECFTAHNNKRNNNNNQRNCLDNIVTYTNDKNVRYDVTLITYMATFMRRPMTKTTITMTMTRTRTTTFTKTTMTACMEDEMHI